MAVCCADKLQQAAERHEYGECAQLLEAVQQLAANFEEYSSIPKIAELRGRVAALQVEASACCTDVHCRKHESQSSPTACKGARCRGWQGCSAALCTLQEACLCEMHLNLLCLREVRSKARKKAMAKLSMLSPV